MKHQKLISVTFSCLQLSVKNIRQFHHVETALRYLEFFGQTGANIESAKTPPLLVPSGEIFKILASRYSKNALPGSVCFCISLSNIFRLTLKIIQKLFKLTLRKKSFREWILKNSYIRWLKNLYEYKLARPAKQSNQNRCSNKYRRNHWKKKTWKVFFGHQGVEFPNWYTGSPK